MTASRRGRDRDRRRQGRHRYNAVSGQSNGRRPFVFIVAFDGQLTGKTAFSQGANVTETSCLPPAPTVKDSDDAVKRSSEADIPVTARSIPPEFVMVTTRIEDWPVSTSPNDRVVVETVISAGGRIVDEKGSRNRDQIGKVDDAVAAQVELCFCRSERSGKEQEV